MSKGIVAHRTDRGSAMIQHGGHFRVEVTPGLVVNGSARLDEDANQVVIELDGITPLGDMQVDIRMEPQTFHRLIHEARKHDIPLKVHDWIVRKMGYKPVVHRFDTSPRPPRALPPSRR